MGAIWSQEQERGKHDEQDGGEGKQENKEKMGATWSQEQQRGKDKDRDEGKGKQEDKEKLGATWSKEQERGKQALEKPKKLPHNYQALMKEANPPLEAAASNELDPRLYEGVLLEQKKMYWVDKDFHNRFKLFARGLSITWSEDPNYWIWESLKDKRDTEIEVARLLDVCWLEVHGTFKTSDLTPEVAYEVAFEVKMEELSYGWNAPVTLRLLGPDGKTQERQEKLGEKPRGQWIQLPVGDFVNPRENGGEIQFSLYEYKDGGWKRGLVIKGAILQPKPKK